MKTKSKTKKAEVNPLVMPPSDLEKMGLRIMDRWHERKVQGAVEGLGVKVPMRREVSEVRGIAYVARLVGFVDGFKLVELYTQCSYLGADGFGILIDRQGRCAAVSLRDESTSQFFAGIVYSAKPSIERIDFSLQGAIAERFEKWWKQSKCEGYYPRANPSTYSSEWHDNSPEAVRRASGALVVMPKARRAS